MADQLARARDPREGGDPRREQRHPVVDVERLAITPEVEEGVAERGIGRGVERLDAKGLSREPEAVAEAVARVRKRGFGLEDELGRPMRGRRTA